MKQLITDFKISLQENYSVIKISAIYTILIYAYFIFSWTLSIDTELATYSLGNSQYLYPLNVQFFKLGRPILGILVWLTGSVPIPYFNSLLAVGLIFCSYIIWIVVLSKIYTDKKLTIIFGLFYLVSPIYIFQLNFVNQNIGIGLGFLLTSISIYFLSLYFYKENNFFSFILSILLLFLSIGIYQSFLIYFLEGSIVVLILNCLKSNFNLKQILKYNLYLLSIVIISLFFYFLTTHIIYLFISKSHYLTNFFDGWSKHHSILKSIQLLVDYIFNIFESRFTIIYALCYIVILPLIFKIRKLYSLIVFIGLITPLLLPIIFLSPMPLRILFSIPLSISMLATVCYKVFNKKRLILVIAIIIALFNFKQICLLTYSKNMAEKYNEKILNTLYQKAYRMIGKDIYHTPIVFVSSKKISNSFFIEETKKQPFYSNSDFDLFSSIFPGTSWQESNLNHRAYFFSHWLNNYYKMPSHKQVKLGEKIAKNMPIYPNEGSIIMKDDILIIKLSN
ncbi:glucosyltransferase domain-containing protein [Francisella sp. 19X1-34]|uniref:glucosyltransferase domain-containing protein n=1 Tax=Francisella sp. 19X1-34 TaxID=3087177 RepID=UPI002E32E39D|nr:glucosyltransferase domain-containing protein [Francisella sp. 19X1-34]MED7787715.1 glucosyltransferase domain-containing protein [Francisella sp. 19X1-34]